MLQKMLLVPQAHFKLWYNAVSVDVLGYTDSEEGIWYWDGDSYETANNGSTALWAAPGQAFFVSSPVGGSTFSFRSGGLTTQASIVSGGDMEQEMILFLEILWKIIVENYSLA